MSDSKQIELIPLEEGETAWLMHALPNSTPLELSFGPGWVALKVDLDDPQPAFALLLAKRGISNQNLDGAGV